MLFDPDITRLLAAIAWVILAFGIYYLGMKRLTPPGGWGEIRDRAGNVSRVLWLRLTGILLFGIVPALWIIPWLKGSLEDYGTVLIFRGLPPWWTYLVLLLIPVAVFRTASSEKNLAAYPQMRIRNWSPFLMLVNILSWLLYLVAYEFLFRGFLLTSSVAVMAGWQAVALNCILYALAHLYKGRFETFGSIPVGILFCYLTLRTGNIWWAVLLHSVMALSNEWFSIRAHPEMHFRKRTIL